MFSSVNWIKVKVTSVNLRLKEQQYKGKHVWRCHPVLVSSKQSRRRDPTVMSELHSLGAPN